MKRFNITSVPSSNIKLTTDHVLFNIEDNGPEAGHLDPHFPYLTSMTPKAWMLPSGATGTVARGPGMARDVSQAPSTRTERREMW